MKKRKKTTSYHHGMIAETIAVILLTLKCYRIIKRRYKTKLGEIDIIALRGKSLIFIEVKKRINYNELFESIAPKQQQRIRKTAELFIARNSKYRNCDIRFDAILIAPGRIPTHIRNAW